MKNREKILSNLTGFFLLVRVQNIILLTLAFYLTAKYIFVPEQSWKELVMDIPFFLLVLSTAIAVASGYIINSFYDYKKDLINRPQKTILEAKFNQKKRLYLYFFFNFLATAIAFAISWRAALFISAYIFLIWFYSHKLRNYTLAGNLSAAVLYIFPFFGIFLFFKKFNYFIFWHAVFLFLLLLIKDLVKSIINLKGEIVEENHSFPVRYGEKKTYKLILGISILIIIPILLLFGFQMLGNMRFYFYLFVLLYYPMLYLTIQSEKYQLSSKLYFVIKLLLLIGVFSLMLIKH